MGCDRGRECGLREGERVGCGKVGCEGDREWGCEREREGCERGRERVWGVRWRERVWGVRTRESGVGEWGA